MSLISTLNGHTGHVTCAHFSPLGHRIASGSADNLVKVWDAESNEYKCLSTLSGHLSYVLSVAWSPDGQKIASGSADYRIRIWDVSNYCECPYFNEFQFVD